MIAALKSVRLPKVVVEEPLERWEHISYGLPARRNHAPTSIFPNMALRRRRKTRGNGGQPSRLSLGITEDTAGCRQPSRAMGRYITLGVEHDLQRLFADSGSGRWRGVS